MRVRGRSRGVHNAGGVGVQVRRRVAGSRAPAGEREQRASLGQRAVCGLPREHVVRDDQRVVVLRYPVAHVDDDRLGHEVGDLDAIDRRVAAEVGGRVDMRPRMLVERPRADVEAVVGDAELVADAHRVVDGVERELGGQRVREVENTLGDPRHVAIITPKMTSDERKGLS